MSQILPPNLEDAIVADRVCGAITTVIGLSSQTARFAREIEMKLAKLSGVLPKVDGVELHGIALLQGPALRDALLQAVELLADSTRELASAYVEVSAPKTNHLDRSPGCSSLYPVGP